MDGVSPFTEKVLAVVKKIPRGRVATYKQVAALAGRPHASRGVAWILNTCAKKHALPWQRVIRSEGRIAFKPGTRNFLLQARGLRGEGVAVAAGTGAVDLKKFGYRRYPRKAARRRGQPKMFA